MFSIGVIAARSSRSTGACRAVRVTYFIQILPPFTGLRLGRSLFFFGFAARTSVMFIGLSSAVSGYLARGFFADGFTSLFADGSAPNTRCPPPVISGTGIRSVSFTSWRTFGARFDLFTTPTCARGVP